MLPSEFYDRTHVTLSAEEYAKVEHIYNSVQMDKDEFCRLWLVNRDNQMIKELMKTISNLEAAVTALQRVNTDLQAKEQELRADYEKRLDKQYAKFTEHQESIAGCIIDALVSHSINDDGKIYDIIEEEFTLDFIVKHKLSKNHPLEDFEREHLIKKL